MNCTHCGDTVATARWAIGRRTCMPCGEAAAKQERKWKASMCIPINKSTPTYISDINLLRQLNPKRTDL